MARTVLAVVVALCILPLSACAGVVPGTVGVYERFTEEAQSPHKLR